MELQYKCHNCNKKLTKKETYWSNNAKHFKRCKYCNSQEVYLLLQ